MLSTKPWRKSPVLLLPDLSPLLLKNPPPGSHCLLPPPTPNPHFLTHQAVAFFAFRPLSSGSVSPLTAQIHTPNLFTWNSILRQQLQQSNASPPTAHPLSLYKQFLETGLRPNGQTFVYLIKATATHLETCREVEQIHCHVVKIGFELNDFVSTALVMLYASCGLVVYSREVFDGIPQPGLVSWTAMISAYVNSNCLTEGLDLLRGMRSMGIVPDSVALAIVISACGQLEDLVSAMTLHGFICKSGVVIDSFVSTELLRVYGDCGSLCMARQMFEEMPVRNVVACNVMIHHYMKQNHVDIAYNLFKEMPTQDVISFNTLISGFCRLGRCSEALEMFHEMELFRTVPNRSTLCAILSACASLGALETGIWIHAYTEKKGLNTDGFIDTGLIDMYAKCGSIEKALQVFEKVPRRTDLYSWTSMICGLAMHGHANHSLRLFTQMLEARVKPDSVTWIGILNACAHGGLIDQGSRYFVSMKRDYHITPTIEHYGCMVDLFGRTGCLREAYDFVMAMDMEPNAVIWGTLLSACRIHSDVELGEIVARRLIELDDSDPWARVMLSNMYAGTSKWEGVTRLRKDMKEVGIKKMPGCSAIEVYGEVHEFLASDRLHPQHAEINMMLEIIENGLLVLFRKSEGGISNFLCLPTNHDR